MSSTTPSPWSAEELLAAQGRQAGKSPWRRSTGSVVYGKVLKKTRQGFVTGLLQNLGDDPLTPEVLDDLESLLLRADAGVKATDQVLDALRQRMNEEVVMKAKGFVFSRSRSRSSRGSDQVQRC